MTPSPAGRGGRDRDGGAGPGDRPGRTSTLLWTGAALLFGLGVAAGIVWTGDGGRGGPAAVGAGRPADTLEAGSASVAGTAASARGDAGEDGRSRRGSARSRAGAPEAAPGAPAGAAEGARPSWPRSASGSQEASPRRRTPVVEAARTITPSVVSIRVRRPSDRRARGFFELFAPFQDPGLVPGLGSGFAIDEQGHILTNAHVVRNARELMVADAQGRTYRAQLAGLDELTDIALLEIPAGRVPPVPLGTSSDLLVGEPVLALGNPFGFHLANTEATVTSGVVSGVSRDIRSDDRRGVLYADMIQTDAAINPGNSGGPLVNVEGRVVGVNSAILSESGGSEGLGFAIPIDRALRIAEELRRFGRVRQPWVGLDVASIRPDTLLSQTVVRRVAPDSPARRAGLREGDVIVSLAGHPIDGPLDWEIALLDAGVGSEVTVRYRRDGAADSARLSVEGLPSERAERVEVLRGLQLVSVNRQIALERNLEVERGALIVDVESSVARVTRMREGDVILAVNRRQVNDAEDAAALFRAASGGELVQVWLYRNGGTVITTFRVR